MVSGTGLYPSCFVFSERFARAHREKPSIRNARLTYSCAQEGAIPRRIYTDPEELADDYEHFQKALGKRLKQLRKDRGFSLRDMTVLHGYAESQWRRMEREGVATTQSLLRIAKAFQTTVADLIDGIGQYPKALGTHRQKAVEDEGSPRIATWTENATALKDSRDSEVPKEQTFKAVAPMKGRKVSG